MDADILEGLTPEQVEVVTGGDGPMLVVAGAGTGKTRVITRRVAWLVANGVPPSRILAITFTNKAAREMKERISRWVDSPRMWISTFHSACARILRREIHRLPPYTGDYSIADEHDRLSLVRDIMDELRLDKDSYKPSSVADAVSALKNSPDPAAAMDSFPLVPRSVLEPVFERYAEVMRESNTLDFDDLLLLAVRLFEEHPDTLARYRERFRHVLVDEYQDINAVQNRFLRLLCAPSGNICAVGDPDQAIYGWRGADIGNIMRFEKDFKGARVLKLTRNFRSTNAILAAANRLIANNTMRYSKELRSDRGEGDPPVLLMCGDDLDEARRVIGKVRELVESGRAAPGECAVLYRVNAQSRPFEEECMVRGVPHVLVGAVAFFRRREIKDVIAYLRVIFNPLDSLSLQRIINRPARGIGPGTVARLKERAAERGVGMLDVVLDPALRDDFPKRANFSLDGFASLYRKLRALPHKPVAGLVRSVLEITAYTKGLSASRNPADAEVLANLGQLVNEAARFDDESGGDLRDFLETVSLVSDADDVEEESGALMLMTLHAAKGLEFRYVFLTGMEEGLLPHDRSKDEPHALEEERRLCYVGMTRAKDGLFLSCAARRRVYGEYRPTRPSRFLRETGVGRRTPVPRPRTGPLMNFDLEAFRRRTSQASAEKTEDEPPGAVAYKVGDIIEHAQFGPGRIEKISGRGAATKITVFFRHYGTKVLVLEYAAPKLVLKRRSKD